MDALLTAALRLIDPGETATLIEVHTGRHAALYSLGRLEEADEEYRTIDELCADRLGPRGRDRRAGAQPDPPEPLRGGGRLWACESLRELGIAVPAADRLAAELDRQFGYLYRWLDETDAADDLARPEITDPALLAAARLINALLPPAYFAADHATFAWLSLEALRIWLEHGPSRALVGPVEPRGLRRCDAARRLRRRVPGAAADPGGGRGPRLRARHLAGPLPVRARQLAGSSRSRTPSRRLSGPGRG